MMSNGMKLQLSNHHKLTTRDKHLKAFVKQFMANQGRHKFKRRAFDRSASTPVVDTVRPISIPSRCSVDMQKKPDAFHDIFIISTSLNDVSQRKSQVPRGLHQCLLLQHLLGTGKFVNSGHTVVWAKEILSGSHVLLIILGIANW